MSARTGIHFGTRATHPVKMAEVARKHGEAIATGSELSSDSIPPVRFPLRQTREIIRLLKTGMFEDISILEWLILFEDSAVWKELKTDDQVADLCATIFKAILKYSRLKTLTATRSVRFIEGDDVHFPSVLLDYFGLLTEAADNEATKRLFETISNAYKGDYEAILDRSVEEDFFPEDFLEQCDLAHTGDIGSKIIDEIPNKVLSLDVTQHAEWIHECLLRLDDGRLPKTIDAIIKSFTRLDDSSAVIHWIQQNCDPRNESTYWNRLSPDSQRTLSRHLDFGCFHKVEDIVEEITRHATTLRLEEYELRQLKSRRLFWSHYQSRISNVRILVPKTAAEEIPRDVYSTTLRDEHGTEVIILEFDRHIIVDFLRATADEIRIFPKNTRNRYLLFEEENLSLNDIRSAHQNDVHDHRWCWQWSAEKWLREQFSITPDESVKRFRGLPPDLSVYEKGIGLPTPDQEDLARRNQELAKWEFDFYKRENALNKYGTSDSTKVQALLRNAGKSYRLKQYAKMRRELEEAISLGSDIARESLGNWLISKPRGSKAERLEGERLLATHIDQLKQDFSQVPKVAQRVWDDLDSLNDLAAKLYKMVDTPRADLEKIESRLNELSKPKR